MLNHPPAKLVVHATVEREEPTAAFKDRVRLKLTVADEESEGGVIRHVDLEVTINNEHPLTDLLLTLLKI